jgi:hypothetical protein
MSASNGSKSLMEKFAEFSTQQFTLFYNHKDIAFGTGFFSLLSFGYP